MKNACIVLHNYRNVPDPAMTNGIVGAFLSGGYCFDRLEFLPRNDIGAFKQAVAEAKSFFDNLVVVAEPELYSALRDQMELCYNTSFLTQAILDAGQKVAVLLPCGGAGERIAREDAVPFLDGFAPAAVADGWQLPNAEPVVYDGQVSYRFYKRMW